MLKFFLIGVAKQKLLQPMYKFISKMKHLNSFSLSLSPCFQTSVWTPWIPWPAAAPLLLCPRISAPAATAQFRTISHPTSPSSSSPPPVPIFPSTIPAHHSQRIFSIRVSKQSWWRPEHLTGRWEPGTRSRAGRRGSYFPPWRTSCRRKRRKCLR